MPEGARATSKRFAIVPKSSTASTTFSVAGNGKIVLATRPPGKGGSLVATSRLAAGLRLSSIAVVSCPR